MCHQSFMTLRSKHQKLHFLTSNLSWDAAKKWPFRSSMTAESNHKRTCACKSSFPSVKQVRGGRRQRGCWDVSRETAAPLRESEPAAVAQVPYLSLYPTPPGETRLRHREKRRYSQLHRHDNGKSLSFSFCED